MKTEITHSELEPATPPAWKLLAAFGAIYIIWGSTYLAIRYAVESIPPFMMAGTRSLAAGMLLYAFARGRGAAAPTRREWRDAFIAGGLMLTIGNGGVTWAELFIPSGVTALLVALVPLWMVLFEWLRPKGVRPRPMVFVGLAVGFAGVALLARNHTRGVGSVQTWGVVVLMAASVAWALGAIFNRHARKPGSPLLAIGMQMIGGGALLLVLAGLHGEGTTFSISRITGASFGAWCYLTVMGSLIGFTAYVWLLQVSTPARVSTSAYVNPLIAVLLGCTIGREPVSPDLFIAGGIIILAVALIVRSGARSTSTSKKTGPSPEPSAVPIEPSRGTGGSV